MAKVTYLPHPARSVTPPDEDAFAFLAARDFEQNEAIEVYGGNLWLEEDIREKERNGELAPHTDHYAYAIDTDRLKEAGYTGEIYF